MKIMKILFAFFLFTAMAGAQDVDYTILRTSVICKQPDRYIGWPTIAQAREGELLVVFSGNRDEHVCPFGVTQLVRSHDGGETWSNPVTINNTPLDDRDAGILQTRRGTLLVSRINISAEDSMHYFWEPHVVQVAGDTLLAMFRYQPRDRSEHFMRQSMSHDDGLTWTTPERTPLWGYPPHLIKLRDGRLLVSYGHRREPYGERACLSSAAGRWEVKNIITIAAAMNGDLGYPASVHLADGSIFTVYYQIDQPGEKTCLMGTRWVLGVCGD